MKIKIGISSNINFYEKTIEKAINSYIAAGIDNRDIHVAVGGSQEEKTQLIENVTFDFVKYNSFDWTFSINLLEKQYKSDYWFITHDTAFAGPKFKNIIYNRIQRNEPYVALNSSFTKSTGLLRKDYYFNEDNVNFLKFFKQKSLEILDPAEIKKFIMASDIENKLFGKKEFYFCDNSSILMEYGENYYQENGSKRLLEYFPELDYFKLSSNFGGAPLTHKL